MEIKTASYDSPIEVGPGGSFVVIGGVAATTPVVPEDPIEAANFTGDGEVGFNDFLIFAQNFGKGSADADFNARIDLDGDGEVGFSDFLKFVLQFGKKVGG